jgi:hypothetical protein
MVALRFAAIKVWKDNPNMYQIVEWFASENETLNWISDQENSELYIWHVGEF